MKYDELLNSQREFFNTETTQPYEYRIKMLNILKQSVIKYEEEIKEALKKDLNKSYTESYVTEISTFLSEINYMIKNLRYFIKAKKVPTPIVQFYSKSRIIPEPYGTVLIISPWNYPFYLTLAPLIGAIAAGNTAIIKPSDYSGNTCKVIKKIINNSFSRNYIEVITGGREENSALLDCKFDYIFFTGSPTVGKIVMEKATEHLTPVSLELGGKSPCIVDKTANIKLAAKRIIFGKTLNGGQTCVAPDYVLIDKQVKNLFINYCKKYITEFFGEDPIKSNDLVHIINEKHFNRLIGLIENEKIVSGGKYNKDKLLISPTILDNITFESKIMQEEIFGPILPIIEYESIADAVNYINVNNKPLALYMFSKNKTNIKNVISSCSFGGGCVNDTIMHIATPYMPFGGVGNSGVGSYHGKASFDTFTHYKSILQKTTLFDIPLRYYPYTKEKSKLLHKIL